MNVIATIAASVIEKITTAVKSGEPLPWQKPWAVSDFVNAASKHVFQGGFNRYSLAFLGQGESRFATFKQIKACGGQLKKGSCGIPLLMPMLVDEEKNGVKTKKCIGWRYYTVFALRDVTGGEFPVGAIVQIEDFKPIAEIEDVVKNHDVQIEFGGGRAFFDPSSKSITLPERQSFESEVSYYQVLVHELSHWAAEHVGQRDLSNVEKEEGFHAYGFEELRAEITSCMVLSYCGVEPKADNSAAYVQSWLSALNNNPEWLVKAINHAEKRAKWILGIEEEKAAA